MSSLLEGMRGGVESRDIMGEVAVVVVSVMEEEAAAMGGGTGAGASAMKRARSQYGAWRRGREGIDIPFRGARGACNVGSSG